MLAAMSEFFGSSLCFLCVAVFVVLKTKPFLKFRSKQIFVCIKSVSAIGLTAHRLLAAGNHRTLAVLVAL